MITLLRWSICILTTFAITNLTLAIGPKDPPSSLHGRYIVTLDRDKTKSLGEFIAHLDSKGVKHEVVLDMTELVPEVFYGASVRLSDEADLKHLEGSAHVEHRKSAECKKFPVPTRVTELHKMGLYGKGIKVALVDSGIDCTHPALGGGFGPGFKIAFGKNYAEDDNDDGDAEDGVTPHGYEPLAMRLTARGTKPKPKNESPCTQCTSHGTHVAGIVAASDVGYGFMGVAPNATLGMYLFGCGEDGDSSSDSLMAAFLQAHKDGADIISASIGGPGGWGNGEELVKIVNNLVQMKGAIVIVAAGNEGSEGLFYADDPASAKSAISVGSVEAQAIVAGKFKASTGRELTLYRTSTLNLTGEHRVYITANSSHDPADACDELPKNTPNLTDHVVLVKRGEACRGEGWEAHSFYMNSTSIVTLPNTMKNATVARSPCRTVSTSMIRPRRIQVVSKFHFRQPVTFIVSPSFAVLVSTCKNRRIALLSKCAGRRFAQQLQPIWSEFRSRKSSAAVSAVGGNVVSTFPMNNGGYSSLSGTSMATPQIAGIVALILSARGKNFTGLTMRSRLATATKLLNRVNSPSLDSAVHQGGGLIDAFCAVWTNTTMSTSSLVLNDSVSFQGNQEFTISNNGTRNVNYILTHRQAVTLETFSAATKYNRPDIQPTSSNQSARAQIIPQSFVLPPGSSQVVKVNFIPPQSLDPKSLAVYSGFIVMTSDADCESHNLPYYGCGRIAEGAAQIVTLLGLWRIAQLSMAVRLRACFCRRRGCLAERNLLQRVNLAHELVDGSLARVHKLAGQDVCIGQSERVPPPTTSPRGALLRSELVEDAISSVIGEQAHKPTGGESWYLWKAGPEAAAGRLFTGSPSRFHWPLLDERKN
ncbi:hypothetical protein H4Q26_007090 [Puccinia striiformis f. sp. tritici PST-130]|nr:hypothetical protein H4Q26_007090 [Puccinia striiformis f. sp. tritici PST-130]